VNKVNLQEKLSSFSDQWSPKIVANYNGNDVMVVRVEGEFVRQPGVRAEYSIDEPSDGYVGVVFRAVDGSFATGAGNVVVLEFEALRPGASRIELRDVKSVAAGGEPNRNVIVTHATVTIH